MDFMECDDCTKKPGSPQLCPACLNNRSVIETLKKQLTEKEEEIKIDNNLLSDKNRLLHSIPECPVHGTECIPHAIEWINRVKTLGKIIMG